MPRKKKGNSTKKSRFFYLDTRCNASKIQKLEALHMEYLSYLQICVDHMVAQRRFNLPKSEKKSFFPSSNKLSSQIVKNVQDHAISIVSGWSSSRYATKIKKTISKLKYGNFLTEEHAKILYTIGKFSKDKPYKNIEQRHIDAYWFLLLNKGSTPKIRQHEPMRMSEMTCSFMSPKKTKTVSWWLSVSTLTKGKRTPLPLNKNPYINNPDQVSKGVLARKTKSGRWRFELVEKKDYIIPEHQPTNKRLGVDVGLNALAVTSDGNIFGTEFKPEFDRKWKKIKEIRANRQRQGLKENSPRLDKLEHKLSEFIKTTIGQIANLLVENNPSTTFVLEDLDLRGCKGQKRFAYRALQKALSLKAPIIKINPAYTSQECPSCGYISRKNRAGTKFQCHSCGRKAHADWVGARNILRRSEDKDISCGDHPNSVKIKLQKRYLLRRNSFVILSDASLPLDQTPNDLVENKELNSIVKIT